MERLGSRYPVSHICSWVFAITFSSAYGANIFDLGWVTTILKVGISQLSIPLVWFRLQVGFVDELFGILEHAVGIVGALVALVGSILALAQSAIALTLRHPFMFTIAILAYSFI